MNLRPEFIEKIRIGDIPLMETHTPTFSPSAIGGFVNYFCPKKRDILYNDIVQIEFKNLYTNLLIGLYDCGLIDKKWHDDIQRVRWFLENRNDLKLLSYSSEYQKWKIFNNSLYSKIRTPYVVYYISLFYQDIVNKYGDKIIYIDTDKLILDFTKNEFQSKQHIPELNDFKYDITFINYFYIEDIKRYIIQDEFGQIESRGMKDPKKSDLESIIKVESRRKKLDIIGI